MKYYPLYTVILFSFFVSSFSLDIQSIHEDAYSLITTQLGIKEGQSNDECIKATCTALAGESCPTFNCSECESTLLACKASARNASQFCACYTESLACVLSAPASAKCQYRDLDFINDCHKTKHLYFPECTCPPYPTWSIPLCNLNSYCDQDTGLCASKRLIGEQCEEDSNCGEPVGYGTGDIRCISGTCQTEPGTQDRNDGCVTTADCRSGLTCTQQRCTGANLNESCTYTYQCPRNAYCDGTKCVPRPQSISYANCSIMVQGGQVFHTCSLGYICGYQGICIPELSAQLGAQCNPGVVGECAAGTFCKYAGPSAPGTCAAVPSELTLCQDNSDCSPEFGPSSRCTCRQYEGDFRCTVPGVFPQCPQYEQLRQCMIDNQCNELSSHPTSCVMRSCSDHVKKFLQCYVISLPDLKGYAGCWVWQEEVSTTGESSTGLLQQVEDFVDSVGFPVVIAAGAVILIVVAIIIACVVRSRKPYKFDG